MVKASPISFLHQRLSMTLKIVTNVLIKHTSFKIMQSTHLACTVKGFDLEVWSSKTALQI